jgi:hypothetical protein
MMSESRDGPLNITGIFGGYMLPLDRLTPLL